MPVFIANRQWVAVLLAVFMAVALSACGGGGSSTSAPPMPDPPPTPMPDPAIAEREAISTAIMAASTAVNAVNNDSTDAQVTAADTAITNAKNAIAAATNVPADERAANTGTVNALETQLSGAKTARMTAMDDAQKAADMAMAVTAAKLHAGIAAQNPATNSLAANTALTGTDERGAAYNDADNPTAGTAADTRIMVGIGTAAVVALSEDKKTMVADNHGWAGKRYTRTSPAAEGMYEAVVYSNVGEPTKGAKFNSGTGDGNVGFDLDSGSDDTVTFTTGLNEGAKIASPMFTHSAGSHTFKLPEDNPGGLTMIPIDGSYYGVEGTYVCTPATGACTVNKAAKGYTFANPTAWTFTADDPEARVTSAPDAIYASYGWWIHKSADGKKFTASAFVDEKGTVPAASGLDTLQGTATYMGGAAGKYALSSSTGGTNDAGHFTAKATLEADFSDNSITGTIDNFIGADGEARDWSVELKEGAVAATGEITRAAENDTVWTIGETSASASGEWSGTLRDNGDDLVPKVATGTFYSEFETAGKMVGAFGVNKQ